MVILDNDEESDLDLKIRVILLNQHTQKPLSVITIEKEFLNSIQKFTSP